MRLVDGALAAHHEEIETAGLRLVVVGGSSRIFGVVEEELFPLGADALVEVVQPLEDVAADGGRRLGGRVRRFELALELTGEGARVVVVAATQLRIVGVLGGRNFKARNKINIIAHT